MARPKKKDRVQFSLNLYPDELEYLDSSKGASSRSDYMRQLLNDQRELGLRTRIFLLKRGFFERYGRRPSQISLTKNDEFALDMMTHEEVGPIVSQFSLLGARAAIEEHQEGQLFGMRVRWDSEVTLVRDKNKFYFL